MPYLNPAYKGAFAHTEGAALTVTVAFDAPSVAGGLSISPSHCPTELGVPASECAWYAVQTVDGCVGRGGENGRALLAHVTPPLPPPRRSAWHNATAAVSADGFGLILSVDLTVRARLPASLLHLLAPVLRPRYPSPPLLRRTPPVSLPTPHEGHSPRGP